MKLVARLVNSALGISSLVTASLAASLSFFFFWATCASLEGTFHIAWNTKRCAAASFDPERGEHKTVNFWQKQEIKEGQVERAIAMTLEEIRFKTSGSGAGLKMQKASILEIPVFGPHPHLRIK